MIECLDLMQEDGLNNPSDGMDETTVEATESSPPASSSRLTSPIACRACGYNLLGLAVDSRCPECGTPVGMSLRGTPSDPFLRYSHPDWVRKLAHGTVWIILAIFGALLVGCLGSAMLRNSSLGISREWFEQTISIFGDVVMFVGVWLVTTPERTEQAPARSIVFTRWLARAAPLASISTTLIEVVPFVGANASLGVQIISFLFTLLWVAGCLALLVYGLYLARRLPQSSLYGHTKIVLWGWSVTLGLLVIVALLFLLMSVIGAPPFNQNSTSVSVNSTGFLVALAIPGTCVVALASVFFGIWSIVLLIRYQGQISEEHRLARAYWERGR